MPKSRTPDRIWLASQSPRRQELLKQIGIAFDTLLPADAAEAHALEELEAVLGREAPATYVQRVTALKAEAALARMKARGLEPRPVLCADTTVALGRDILSKPESDAHAVEMLSRLAGGTHRVLTAVCVVTPRKRAAALSVSSVTIAPMTPAQIRAYVASGEPRGKAGAYAIQGRMAAWVAKITGSHSGIMGLPLHETAALLRDFRLAAPNFETPA
ncbi:Maf family protein [Derxia gummosa]|uniref:dTTP/UTP pyrophosphatase n=1 Tax=Derxia gummosa DSM 723 TaxID=1121388 RepID=A0A8B6X2V5_9BURK|nr:Maf family protein [Derxia gummosa]